MHMKYFILKLKIVTVFLTLITALATSASDDLPDVYIQTQIDKLMSSLSSLDTEPTSEKTFVRRFRESFQAAEVLAEELDLHMGSKRPAMAMIREAFQNYVSGIDQMSRKMWAVESQFSDTTWAGVDLLASEIKKTINKRFKKYIASLSPDEIQTEMQREDNLYISRVYNQALASDSLLKFMVQVIEQIAPTGDELKAYKTQAIYAKRARTAENYISFMAVTTSALTGVILNEWLTSAVLFYMSLKIKNGLPVPNVNRRQESLATTYQLQYHFPIVICGYLLTNTSSDDKND
jgi:hypothetical protein